MRKVLIAALLGSSIFTTPAMAVHGISLDGASMMTAYVDPFAIPFAGIGVPSNVRYGVVNFRFSSIGQVNSGWVQYYTAMYPSNQYDGPFKIRFFDSSYINGDIGPGSACVDLAWDIDNKMGNNSDGTLDAIQQQDYFNSNCDNRPDPHLYNSGAKMGIELRLSSIDGGWLIAQWGQVAPMDGGQYNVTMFWFTGKANDVGLPYAKIVVSKRGGPTGTLADPDYVDASYNYTGDGFDVQFSNLYWQMGCDTTDTSYVDTCATLLTGEFWLYPTDETNLLEIHPVGTFMGNFLSGDNSAPFIGSYGQFPLAFPPEIYNTGDDTTFIINAADIGYGLTTPQTFLSQGWSQNGVSNPNYNFPGAGIQASGQDF